MATISATGRRKNSTARVFLTEGTGKITVNGRALEEYFGLATYVLIVKQPLVLLGLEGKYDIKLTVKGGGLSGQAGACRHAIARAIDKVDTTEYHTPLKRAGFLTRDPRMKERKKYGLKAARRAPQFSKR